MTYTCIFCIKFDIIDVVFVFCSVTVPLSHDRVWSSQKSKFTGRSHRAVFDNSLHEIYKDLYNKAKNAQT